METSKEKADTHMEEILLLLGKFNLELFPRIVLILLLGIISGILEQFYMYT